MDEKRDINKQLKDVDTMMEKAMEQMTDSFATSPVKIPEYTEEFFQNGFPDDMELDIETELKKD